MSGGNVFKKKKVFFLYFQAKGLSISYKYKIQIVLFTFLLLLLLLIITSYYLLVLLAFINEKKINFKK